MGDSDETVPGIPRLSIRIIGDVGVGKTSLFYHYVKLHDMLTADVAKSGCYHSSQMLIHGKYVKVKICNISTMEIFSQSYDEATLRSIYSGVHGVVLVYDVSNRDSFSSLEAWVKEVKANSAPNSIILMIVGNNINQSNRKVATEEGTQFARRHRSLFMETSVESMEGVQKAFSDLIRKILETHPLFRPKDDNVNVPQKPKYQNSCTCL